MSGRGRGGIGWALGLILVLAGCTSGNVVSDFREPPFILVDRLGEGVEIRRYGEQTEAGREVAEIQAERTADLEPQVISGLVAVKPVSGDDPDAEAAALVEQLRQSANWQPAGEPVNRSEDTMLAILGRDGSVLMVPIVRQRPALES